MTNKELYTQWSDQQTDMPIFMRSWWLDAVCAGKGWDVLLYIHPRTEQILAALPYLTGKRLKMRYILMPQQTQIGGIWIDQSLLNDDGSVWDKETLQNICTYMTDQLARLNLCYYYQHYPLTSPCPPLLQQEGMKVKKRVTYRIEDTSDLEKVVKHFSKDKQRLLRNAEHLQVQRGLLNAEQFFHFHQQCLNDKNKQISYSREFFLVLERKTKRNNCSEIISINDENGEIYAAAYVVWDKRSLYYVISAVNPQYTLGGTKLVSECIKLAHELHLAFDFEGSMIRGVAKFYKQFGSQPSEYYSVEKFYKWWFRIPYWAYRLSSHKRR